MRRGGPQSGSCTLLCCLSRGEGAEGPLRGPAAPPFRQSPLSLVPRQRQRPTRPTPGARAAGPHSGEWMEFLPWEAWGAGAHPSPGMFRCVRWWAGGSEGPKQREKVEAWEPTGLPLRSAPTGLGLPREGPHLFCPERKPRHWSWGKPARGRSPRKWQNKASVGQSSWRRVGGNKLSQI